MHINNDFCCERMMLAAKDIACPLFYTSRFRSYSMYAPQSLLKKNEFWAAGYTVDYCPFCGAQVPKDLTDERCEILEKEYGITDPYDPPQRKRIPKEFKTDVWWKKRGL